MINYTDKEREQIARREYDLLNMNQPIEIDV